ncbi:ribonuclease R [Fulvivirga lutea]|uniref:Ribonuclease R n=1 Tax=Fulvivirga lutea TaxID=2810512 RepID=A0A974WGH3_9BACT|nr:ribonuclease R [Fulvivirga lutea]QSE98068.1 ribonuclease R [Fulvivirga lutea]
MSKKRKKQKAGKSENIQEKLSQKIVNLLNSNSQKAYSVSQITKKLGFRRKDYNREIPYVVKQLERDSRIQALSNGSYKSNRETEFIEGTVDHVNPRFAYVIPKDGTDDIYVSDKDLKFAMDGDKVRVGLKDKKHGKHAEGVVLEILERGKDEIVGRIEFSPRFAFVIADNRKIHQDVFVSLNETMKAAHNDKVIVKIKQWPSHDKSPEGEVIRILGKAGENNAEIHSIMAEFDLPFEFPNHVEEEAEAISEQLPKDEIAKRKDFRGVTTFTIDPEDAKDFDDALSYRKLDNGNTEVGVHIADVTYYVQPNTQLEKEAYDRATSVYLVDRTIPMLPEKLSNGLCSLRPNEDKFTFAAVFELDEEAKIVNEWFGRTVIHSDRRFAYEEAQQGIETGEGDFGKELQLLNALAKKLKAKKFAAGAVNFETTEVKFKLDEKGKPLGVIPKVRQDAHKLIEEFMLLANRQVARFVYGKKKGEEKLTFVYRTHDFPDPEKIETFATFARRFGHELKTEGSAVSKSLNNLMTEIEGKPEENVLQQLAIRSMAKAKYTTEAMGHFGLAFDHYSHFTSPIRRYPDMMVHRLLQHYLDGGKSAKKEDYEEKCVHSSEREKRAAEAERASIKYKQVEYMSLVEEKVFDGIISGVTEWGIFIEIVATKCEGMVRMVDLKDDYYEFDEKNYRVIGRKNKKMYSLGDKVTVAIKNTDIDRRTIDLEFVDEKDKFFYE